MKTCNNEYISKFNGMKIEHIELTDMLKHEVDAILNKTSGDKYFWMDGNDNLHEIVELDLFRGRFITDNGDFSEFDWELEHSRIYRMVKE